jgi:hypothetical protein
MPANYVVFVKMHTKEKPVMLTGNLVVASEQRIAKTGSFGFPSVGNVSFRPKVVERLAQALHNLHARRDAVCNESDALPRQFDTHSSMCTSTTGQQEPNDAGYPKAASLPVAGWHRNEFHAKR